MISCETCTFWDRAYNSTDERGLKPCHRYPNFILTPSHYWCGEYSKGPNRQDVSVYMDKKK